ncbi:MAG: hypothetical protein IJ043_01645 [Clostridia bacterium]|nr:hypothetical protein [Clostridia bacterium]
MMYCIKCGVQLADSETQCPLCRTRVFHPDLPCGGGEALYPKEKYPAARRRSFWPQAMLTAIFLLPLLTVLLCDLQFNGGVTWSGYVMGALVAAYAIFVLPTWFKRYYPVIFVPCSFGAAGLYLLYINLFTGGDWFLSFALPLVGGVGILVTAVVTLMVYLPRGRFYIFGGAFMALGIFMLPVELLMDVTFSAFNFMGWSFYPMVALVLLGGLLIFLGICRPARETMERKFFL